MDVDSVCTVRVFCSKLQLMFVLFHKILQGAMGEAENSVCVTDNPEMMQFLLWTTGAVFGIVYILLGEHDSQPSRRSFSGGGCKLS